MIEPPPAPPSRSRRLVYVWGTIGVLLVSLMGIEVFFLLRWWKQGTWRQASDAANTNAVSVAGENLAPALPTNESVDPAPPPRPRRPRVSNDNFVDRFTLDTPAHVVTSNVGATNERGEHIQNTRIGLVRWGDTLWWKWTAPISGPVTIDTRGSSFDTYVTIYTGDAVDALTIVAENDNASEVGVGDSLVTFAAVEGTDYAIQVGGVFTGGGRGSIPTRGELALNLDMPPSVTMTSPLSGGVYPSGSNIVVNVTARLVAGTVTNVSLYRGSSRLGSVSEPPYNFVVNTGPVGTNSLYAVATDGNGQNGTSAVTRVLVASAGITITSPGEDAILQETNEIKISAFALRRSGSLTNVSFFVDGQPIAQTAGAPFDATWVAQSGTHQITARAWDDSGKTFDATPVNIRVARTFFPTGSVWKYLDDGSDPQTDWRMAGFNDSGWKSGPAELGYGDGDEATRVEDNDTPGFKSRDTVHFITAYFRRAFTAANVASDSHLLMNVKRDDGAVVYLNGREAARFNMNTGIVDSQTLARNAGDDGKAIIPATVPADFLIEGTNVIAVEVHQATVDSTDVSFEMNLLGVPKSKEP